MSVFDGDATVPHARTQREDHGRKYAKAEKPRVVCLCADGKERHARLYTIEGQKAMAKAYDGYTTSQAEWLHQGCRGPHTVKEAE